MNLADLLSETEALNYIAAAPESRDSYLTVTRQSTDPRDYELIWPTKGALMRIAARRHHDLAASQDPRTRQWPRTSGPSAPNSSSSCSSRLATPTHIRVGCVN